MTPQTHYQMGYSFERRVWDMLKDNLGMFPIRSAGSHTTIDIIGLNDVGPDWIIQCKRTGLISPSEWNALFELGHRYKKIPVLARMPEGKVRGIEFYELLAYAEPNERNRLEKKAKIIYKR